MTSLSWEVAVARRDEARRIWLGRDRRRARRRRRRF
jgi:hypothetical protein